MSAFIDLLTNGFRTLKENAFLFTTISFGLLLIRSFKSQRGLKQQLSNAKKVLKNATHNTDQVIITSTIFEPSSDTNPETDKAFVDLKIRNHGTVALSDIFNTEAGEIIIPAIKQAATLCTDEKPIITLHLHRTAPKTLGAETRTEAERNIVNFCSDRLSVPGALIKRFSLSPGEKLKETHFKAIFCFEAGAKNRQFRLFLVPESQQTPVGLPEKDNIRVQQGNVFQHIPDHPHMQRLKTHEAIANICKRTPVQVRGLNVSIATHDIVSCEIP